MAFDNRIHQTKEYEIMTTSCGNLRDDMFSIANIRQCEEHIFSMQTRLDNAVAESDYRKTRNLFNQIVKGSEAARILAVNRVTCINNGKKTAGVDGVKLPNETREKQMAWRVELAQEIDVLAQPQPIRRVYIPKRNGKKRPLGIPTIHDRVVQDIYRMALEPIVEYHFSDKSFGFRPKRCTMDAVTDIIKKMQRKVWVVEGDIKGCFGHISHQHILETLTDWQVPVWAVRYIGRMLKSKVMQGYDLEDIESGTPQGGVISPMLANVALTALDNFCQEQSRWRTSSKNKGTYTANPITRYADDFVIVCKTKKEAHEWKDKVTQYLTDTVGVELSDEKTKISHINDDFDFLGFNFKKYEYKEGGKHQSPKKGATHDMILIKPPKDRIIGFLADIQEVISNNKTMTQDSLIKKLNPMIRGWVNYYRKVSSGQIFARIDHEIWWKLYRWSKRRHPQKSKGWVITRYFHRYRGHKTHFCDEERESYLLLAAHTNIRRHRYLKENVRVYDRNEHEYWQKREMLLAEDAIDKRSLTYKLWKRQNGICTSCRKEMGEDDVLKSKVHIHHIKPKSHGGSWSKSNLILIHDNCHQELHSRFSLFEMSQLADLKENYYELVITFV